MDSLRAVVKRPINLAAPPAEKFPFRCFNAKSFSRNDLWVGSEWWGIDRKDRFWDNPTLSLNSGCPPGSGGTTSGVKAFEREARAN